jgi:Big-like domain-containing protein
MKNGSRIVVLIIAAHVLGGSHLFAQSSAELPRQFVDTSYVPPSGQTIDVADGADFQAALDSSRPGDVIVLQSNATFTGNFLLRNKPGSGWITIRTSAPDASLPPFGTRVTPSFANVLPKIVTATANQPVLHTEAGAHHYRFIGVEFGVAPGVEIWNLIELGTGLETSTAQLPHHIVLDRCYVHGTDTARAIRGVAMNSAWTAVIDSHLSNFHGVGYDSQAIGGWSGSGPFKIVNNYLEAAGENVMFGGADPSIAGLVPSDIEFRRNRLFKPPAWKIGDPSYAGVPWTVKNSFELKNAQRVLVDGNTFEGNWAHGQAGFAIVITPRNQGGAAPWSVVQDLTFTNNLLMRSDQGINVSGRDDNFPSDQTKRLVFRNNLLYLVGGRMLQMLNGTANVTFEHNTADHTGETTVNADGAPHSGFVFRDNIVSYGTYGIFGSGSSSGNATLTKYFPNAVVRGNVFAGPNAPPAASRYPPDNFFVSSLDAAGFVDRANRNYRLSDASQYNDAASDGRDIGADIDVLEAARSGTPLPDSTPPSVTITSPPTGVVSGTIAVSASASDNVGVAGVQFRLDGVNLGAEDSLAPYSISWNSTTAPNGPHTLTAVARDAAGNTTISSAVTVIVVNLP